MLTATKYPYFTCPGMIWLAAARRMPPTYGRTGGRLQITGVLVKRVFLALTLMVFLLSGLSSIAEDQEMVTCCIKPCSCLGSKAGKPECKEMRRSECKRLGGEPVADCLMCD